MFDYQELAILKLAELRGSQNPSSEQCYNTAVALGQWVVLAPEGPSQNENYLLDATQCSGAVLFLQRQIRALTGHVDDVVNPSTEKDYIAILRMTVELWFAQTGLENSHNGEGTDPLYKFQEFLAGRAGKIASEATVAYLRNLRIHFIEHGVLTKSFPWILSHWLQDAHELTLISELKPSYWSQIT